MTAIGDLVAACEALSSDGRYARKTRALSSALKTWSADIEQREVATVTAIEMLTAYASGGPLNQNSIGDVTGWQLDTTDGSSMAVSDDGLRIDLHVPGLYIAQATVKANLEHGSTGLVVRLGGNDLANNEALPVSGSGASLGAGNTSSASVFAVFRTVDEYANLFVQAAAVGGSDPELILSAAVDVFRID